MRTKNPGLMTQIQDFVNDFFFCEYRMPSVQEIATATGIAKSSAHRYLVEMDKRGILSYRAGEILTDMVNGLSFAIKNTPLTRKARSGICRQGTAPLFIFSVFIWNVRSVYDF